jgi:cytoskeletal protein RodZ
MNVPAERPTIGSLLHEGRQRTGLSLKEIAERTCIRRAYLEALETDRFELLPGEVYVQGFMRLYAEAIGLDAAPLLEQLRQQRGVGGSEVEDCAVGKGAGWSMTLLWVLLALIFVGAAGGLLYTRWQAAPPVKSATVPAAAPLSRQEAVTTEAVQAPLVAGEVASAEGDGAAKIPAALGRQ